MRRRRPAPGVGQAELPPLFERYGAWMRRHRGLADTTLQNYGRVLARAFAALGDDPACWKAAGLRDFVLELAGQSSHGYARNAVTAIRGFLRYAAAAGLAPTGLGAAVPSLAGWRCSDLPRYLPAEDVERVVAGCDPRTAMGVRDRAVLLLLARLGLRAGEVAQLRFEDIDWREGTLRVVGKGRREARLPLPQEVGNAILAYLREGRPRVPAPQVFVTCTARGGQRGPLRRSRVSGIVHRAIGKAGVNAPHRGAHVLRHSLATGMLRSGASLQTIATVLRHHSLETTAHYAKVDVALLRQVAQPWPEVSSW
jgi:integrase/recombinase XerD